MGKWQYYYGYFIVTLVTIFLGFTIGVSIASARTVVDNYDSYSTGTLTSLVSGWSNSGTGTGHFANIVNTTSFSSPNSVELGSTGSGASGRRFNIGEETQNVYLNFKFKTDFTLTSGCSAVSNNRIANVNFADVVNGPVAFSPVFVVCNTGQVAYYVNDSTFTIGYSNDVLITSGVWHDITILSFVEGGVKYISLTVDGRTDTFATYQGDTYQYNDVDFHTTGSTRSFFWDNFDLRTNGDIVPPPTNTRIEWVNPAKTTPSATTTSRVIDFEFNYYLNSSTHSTSTWTHMLLQLYPLNYSSGEQKITITENIIWDSFENVNKIATTTRDGYYLGTISFWNGVLQEETDCTWWIFGCSTQFPLIGYTSSNNFNVATTTITADAPPFIIDGSSSICADIETSFLGIDVALCKTFVFLFVPSVDYFVNLQNNLFNTLATKKPFGYLFQVKTKFESGLTQEGTAGANIVFENENGLFDNLTIFNWSTVKDFVDDLIPINVVVILTNIGWVLFSLYVWWRLTTPEKI